MPIVYTSKVTPLKTVEVTPDSAPKSARDALLETVSVQEISEFLVETMRNPENSERIRMESAKLMLAYIYGTPTKTMKLETTDGIKPYIDISAVTQDLHKKALAMMPPPQEQVRNSNALPEPILAAMEEFRALERSPHAPIASRNAPSRLPAAAPADPALKDDHGS